MLPTANAVPVLIACDVLPFNHLLRYVFGMAGNQRAISLAAANIREFLDRCYSIFVTIVS